MASGGRSAASAPPARREAETCCRSQHHLSNVSSVRRALLIDVVVCAASFGISVLVLERGDPAAGLRRVDAIAYVLLAVYSAAPVGRRRAPALAVAVGLGAGFLDAAADYPLAMTPVVLLSVYSAAALLSPPTARLVLAISVVAGVVGATLPPGPTDVGVPALIVSAWLPGNFVGSRRAHTEELERTNRQLEQARLELADRAVAQERLTSPPPPSARDGSASRRSR